MGAWNKFWRDSHLLERIVMTSGVAATAFCGGYLFFLQNQSAPLPPLFQDAPSPKKFSDTSFKKNNKAPAKVTVHVAGAVVRPGVFVLTSDARVQDAIRAAGGPSKTAKPDTLNLAAHLEDGEQIRVPTQYEIASVGTPPVITSAHSEPGLNTNEGSSSNPETNKRVSKRLLLSHPININTASPADLDTLPGIGPALAARIIAYRTQHGRFKSLSDLDEVSGIGTKKLDKLRPFVAF